MIITIGGIKGGTGKTTIATHLAVLASLAGHDVLLIDADEQGTASDFTMQRNDTMEAVGRLAGYQTQRLYHGQVRQELRGGLKTRYEHIIIDTGGRDTGSQRAALTMSDKLLIPTQPRTFDMWSLDDTFKVAAESRTYNEALRVFSFINRADIRGRDNQETADALRGNPTASTYLDCAVCNRKAFGNAAAKGLAVIELTGELADAKATAEIVRLYRAVFEVAEGAEVNFASRAPAMESLQAA